MLAMVVLLTPLWAVAQPQGREPREDRGDDRARGAIEIINVGPDDVNVMLWTDQQQQLGDWSIRPGEQVMLQEGGRQLRVNSNYKIQVGDHSGWVNVGQVGQFSNGTWYVSVQDVWQATHADRQRDYDNRRGEVEPQRDNGPVHELVRQFNIHSLTSLEKHGVSPADGERHQPLGRSGAYGR